MHAVVIVLRSCVLSNPSLVESSTAENHCADNRSSPDRDHLGNLAPLSEEGRGHFQEGIFNQQLDCEQTFEATSRNPATEDCYNHTNLKLERVVAMAARNFPNQSHQTCFD